MLFFAPRSPPAAGGRRADHHVSDRDFCDENQPPYLRLLPIETRRNEHSLASLRDQPDQWVHTDLDLDDPESLSRDLQKLTQSRPATRRGRRAGTGRRHGTIGNQASCSIPRWRSPN